MPKTIKTLELLLSGLLLAACSSTGSTTTTIDKTTPDYEMLAGIWENENADQAITFDGTSYARWSIFQEKLTDWSEGEWSSEGSSLTMRRTMSDGEEEDLSHFKLSLEAAKNKDDALANGHYFWISEDGNELVLSQVLYTRNDSGLAAKIFEGLEDTPEYEEGIGILEDGTFFDYAIRVAEKATVSTLASAERFDEGGQSIKFHMDGTFDLFAPKETEEENEEEEEAEPTSSGTFAITTGDAGQFIRISLNGSDADYALAQSADEALADASLFFVDESTVVWNGVRFDKPAEEAGEDAVAVDGIPEGAIQYSAEDFQ